MVMLYGNTTVWDKIQQVFRLRSPLGKNPTFNNFVPHQVEAGYGTVTPSLQSTSDNDIHLNREPS